MRLARVGYAALFAFMLHLPMTVDADSVIHIVRSGDTLLGIARQYGVPFHNLVEVNKIANPDRLAAGQGVVVPGGRPESRTSTPETVAQGGASQVLPGFLWPVKGRITSGYGQRNHPILKRYHFHQGIDIAAADGTPIVAARDGRVIFSGMKNQAGRVVVLEHEDGFATVYAHTALNLVEVGETVRAGQKIALVGRSGLATGPHLYFEVWRDGRHINPLVVLTDKPTRVAKAPDPVKRAEAAPTDKPTRVAKAPDPVKRAEATSTDKVTRIVKALDPVKRAEAAPTDKVTRIAEALDALQRAEAAPTDKPTRIAEALDALQRAEAASASRKVRRQ